MLSWLNLKNLLMKNHFQKMSYRYFYQPAEQHGDQKRRGTDFVWSNNTYRLDRIFQKPGNRILYYLQGGPERAFVREELMKVPEATEKQPDCFEIYRSFKTSWGFK